MPFDVVRVSRDDPRYLLVSLDQITGRFELVWKFGDADAVTSKMRQYSVIQNEASTDEDIKEMLATADRDGSSGHYMMWNCERYIFAYAESSDGQEDKRAVFRKDLPAIAAEVDRGSSFAAAVGKHCLRNIAVVGVTFNAQWTDIVLDAARVGISEVVLLNILPHVNIGYRIDGERSIFQRVLFRVGSVLAEDRCRAIGVCEGGLSYGHLPHIGAAALALSLVLTEYSSVVPPDMTEAEAVDFALAVPEIRGLSALPARTVIRVYEKIANTTLQWEGAAAMVYDAMVMNGYSLNDVTAMLDAGVSTEDIASFLLWGIDPDLAGATQ